MDKTASAINLVLLQSTKSVNPSWLAGTMSDNLQPVPTLHYTILYYTTATIHLKLCLLCPGNVNRLGGEP